MDEQKIKKEIKALEREIAILEWDRKRNQLNPGKEVYLNNIIKKKEKLQSPVEVIQ